MQIPIVHGIYTNNAPDLRVAYPVNMVPVPLASGLSQGYLRPADGLVHFATGLGNDRGGINWNGKCYRVSGGNLIRVNEGGGIDNLGTVFSGNQATLDYSFDRLAVAASNRLFYWSDALGFVQVADINLGVVIDMIWIDGYFMCTDGEFIVVTELNDPMTVMPLKYASSEVDPDPIVALKKLRNEAYAINRYTIEIFTNVGGVGFPFNRVDGAQIQKGAVGTKACCVFNESIAFIGSGRNEPIGVYLGVSSNTAKISTYEIDLLLAQYTEEQLSLSIVEERLYRNNHSLYLHLPDRTVVYDLTASQASETQVWYYLTSSIQGFSQYRAQNFVYCYNEWIGGDIDSTQISKTDDTISTHFGEPVGWQFSTPIIYNEGRGALVTQLELVALTGSVAFGEDPTISTSYSFDGKSWSQNKFIKVGKLGQTQRRLAWFSQGALRNYRIQRFMGDSNSHISVARLEAQISPLAW